MEETHCKTSHGKGYRLEVDHTAIIVVIAGLIINTIYVGMFYIGGLYLSTFMDEFSTSKTVTTLVLSIQSSISYFSGLITGPLITRYGTRPVAVGGALSSTLGIMLSAFTPNIEYLYVTFGFMSGVGFGLLMITNGVAVQQHTSRRRALASGITFIGSGLGAVIMPLITKWAMTTYGWQGSLLFMSGIMLHSLPCALLLRPPPLTVTRIENKEPEIDPLLEKRDVGVEAIPDTINTSKMHTNSGHDTMIHNSTLVQTQMDQLEVDAQHPSHHEMKCSCSRLKTFLSSTIDNDGSLLTPVNLLCIASWLFYFGGNGVIYVLMAVKTESMGFEISQGAALMSFTGIGEVAGRIIGAFVGTLHEELPVVISITMAIASGVCLAAVTLCKTYMQMLLTCIFCGVALGMSNSMHYTTVRDLVGLKVFPWIVSIACTFGGIGNLLLIQILAFAWEQTDSFVVSYLIGGSVLVFTGCMTMSARLAKMSENRKKQQLGSKSIKP